MAKRPNALADALAARVLSSPSNQPTTGYGRIPQGTSSGPALGVGFAPQASQTKQWQQFLSTQGYYTGAVDGKFGPDTRLATMAFQHAMGLAPDGIVGDQTRYAQALYSSVPGKELDAKGATVNAPAVPLPTPRPGTPWERVSPTPVKTSDVSGSEVSGAPPEQTPAPAKATFVGGPLDIGAPGYAFADPATSAAVRDARPFSPAAIFAAGGDVGAPGATGASQWAIPGTGPAQPAPADLAATRALNAGAPADATTRTKLYGDQAPGMAPLPPMRPADAAVAPGEGRLGASAGGALDVGSSTRGGGTPPPATSVGSLLAGLNAPTLPGARGPVTRGSVPVPALGADTTPQSMGDRFANAFGGPTTPSSLLGFYGGGTSAMPAPGAGRSFAGSDQPTPPSESGNLGAVLAGRSFNAGDMPSGFSSGMDPALAGRAYQPPAPGAASNDFGSQLGAALAQFAANPLSYASPADLTSTNTGY